MKKNDWSKERLIRELERIRIVIMNNGKKLISPISESQKSMLEPFGLNDADLRTYIHADT
jgi:hypothetical protein